LIFSRKSTRRKLRSTNIFGNINFKGKPDIILLVIVCFLVLFGLVLVYDSSVIVASKIFGDQFRFLKFQIVWVIIGTITATIAYLFDYHNYPKVILPAILVTIILLILVFVAGPLIFGSRRWIRIGELNIQPSELTKLTFTIYLACWLSKLKQRTGKLKEQLKDHFYHELLPFLLILFVIAFLIIIEPDLGTAAIVCFTALAVYFISGTDAIHTIGSILIVSLTTLIGALAGIFVPYRFSRIQTFLDIIKTGSVPPDEQTRSGYQIHQVLIAIGSGGFTGVGFGESKQKFSYLVGNSAFTDTIFAVFAEEFGFVGDVLLVLVFFLFISRGFKIAQEAPDRLGTLLATGITVWIGLQAFLNIAANIALGPLTGIPLPFLSYGGSSTVVILTAVGILLNISKQKRIISSRL